eukprot:COSAG02_NODE_8134_length_2694_cov_13.058574_2_plen_74_part_00
MPTHLICDALVSRHAMASFALRGFATIGPIMKRYNADVTFFENMYRGLMPVNIPNIRGQLRGALPLGDMTLSN